MGIPLLQKLFVGSYVVRQRLTGQKRYPLVLMLEPLFRCNLACAGCGKIDYPDPILHQNMSVENALHAVDECGAPVVSIAGGEPLLHKQLPEIVRGIVARKKFVYLCTNALLMEKKLSQYEPSTFFTWSVHLDGDKEMHDISVCQQGVYDRAVAAIKASKERGFRVNINCTLFNTAQPDRVAEFFDTVTEAPGADGAGRRRYHRLAGLCLRARSRPAALPQPRQDQAAVPRRVQARTEEQEVVVQPVQHVPGLPRGQ